MNEYAVEAERSCNSLEFGKDMRLLLSHECTFSREERVQSILVQDTDSWRLLVSLGALMSLMRG